MEKINKARAKLNIYCIHKLLLDCKDAGMEDRKIWEDVKECFQSTDYNLDMELRPIETLWGDTSKVDSMLLKRATESIDEQAKKGKGTEGEASSKPRTEGPK